MSSALIGELFSGALLVIVCFVLIAGYPVAFSLAGTSLIVAGLAWLFGAFDFSILHGIASRYFGVMLNEVLVAVPLFVFMGMVLERSGIAEDLLTTMGQLFGKLRGGLGYSVVLVGALLAASTGVVGATVVTMGLISLPAMTRAGYDPKISTGVICASSTLAQIIPPSTVLIFVGDMLQGINQTAQLKRGNFAPEPVSVGDLFAGALLPGLLLVGLYASWVFIRSVMDPASMPALTLSPAERRSLFRRVATALAPPLLLILAVLGSILAGVATPTESASIGALGALILAMVKRRYSHAMLREAVVSTTLTSSMIFVILLGASVFSLVFRGLGGEAMVEDFLAGMPGGAFGAMLFVMLVMFVLGFFLDTFEIIFIVLPICGVPLLVLGIDPIWFGVMIGMVLQTSFLTPPFGFTLFYMRNIAPDSVPTSAIWRGAMPFVALQLVGLAALWNYHGLATWLPNAIFRAPAAVEIAPPPPLPPETDQPEQDPGDAPPP
ncbi:MAG: TRAP transporter large permease subunit [Rhodospirillaceae bacterium]